MEARQIESGSTVTASAEVEALSNIERRVLWLATSIVHHANKVRPNPSGIKVGGHQASSASMVSIMTALWFGHLEAQDRVSVKPHASPVLHAIHYLLGRLDRSYLTQLRSYRGLQSYPSRTKDPYPVDFSTGSVGLGATAPIWAAISRRYASAGTGRKCRNLYRFSRSYVAERRSSQLRGARSSAPQGESARRLACSFVDKRAPSNARGIGKVASSLARASGSPIEPTAVEQTTSRTQSKPGGLHEW